MKRILEHVLQEDDLLVTKIEDGQLWVREVRIVEGERVYHRRVICPGQGINESDKRIKEVVRTIHTPEVIRVFQEAEKVRRLQNRTTFAE